MNFLFNCHADLMGSMNDSAYHFFEDLGRKVSEVSGDSRER